ncbi:hypothetical protein L1049_014863 [Liquidambar formosana]|uniref:PB1 domain-containing protein n=1 Tax=Liquidambar formosana TaxID=63359 RepID=A0AAP0X238_LIQFO
MENYSYTTSYAESGDSSPRCREIDFENPPPWEDQTQAPSNYKVKFMCSYGGKIHPRPNDNQLSYLGGETKILAVDRTIKFSGFISKLYALCDAEVCFKYQLPGEDLDALISVTNDDDLEHMMHEYDRLYRATAKPARLRLFLFPVNRSDSGAFGSSEAKTDRERFVEALNSGPTQSVDGSSPPATVTQNNVDFLFGLDKAGLPPQPPLAAKIQDPVPEPNVPVGVVAGGEDRVGGSDLEIQRRIHELQRLQIGGQEQPMYRPKSDENLVGAYAGDFYAPKLPEKAPPAALHANVQSTVPIPAGYWPENQFTGGGFPATMSTTPVAEHQQVYMIPSQAGVYHAPMMRPMTAQGGQGYYAVQRMSPDVYRDQPVYNVVPPQAAAPPSLPPKVTAYTEGIGLVRPSGGVGVTDTGYAQVGYDSTGRQVYYNAPGGVVPQYQGIAAVSADMRPTAAFSQESKVVTKVSQASV